MSILISKNKTFLTEEAKRKIGSFSTDRLAKSLINEKRVNVYHIKYKSRGLTIAGYVVEPKKKNRAKLPCIIWNRGGSRDFGSIKLGTCFGQMADLALQGYIVIGSQYSGGPGSEGQDDWGGENIKDTLALRKILIEWPHADAATIGMYGWSRGGMMTYRALSLVTWVKAAVIGAAPTDEVTAPKSRKGWREHQISLYGKSKAEQIKRSALYWPEKMYKKTPILILHGSADWRVSVLDSIRMAEKLSRLKAPYRLTIFEGADHSITEFRHEVDQQIYDWFNRFLKKKEKLPNLKLHGN
jgi:dipeptidyl aminopeptidase/acylaminoacyl peptidase